MKTNLPGNRIRNIVISVVILIVILVILFKIDFNIPPKDNMRLASSYPPDGAEYVAIIGIVLLTGYIILLNVLFINRLKGIRKIIANIVVVILFFLILEASLTKYSIKHMYTTFEPHPLLLWVKARGVNSMGFTYPEFPVKKEPGEYRFIILGDSNAEGNETGRFSDITEESLQKSHPDKKIRLINAACSGYSIVQVSNLMKLKIRKLNPDCIIISLNNDPTYDFEEDKKRLPSPYILPLQNLLYRSKLYLLLRKYKLNKTYKQYDGIGRLKRGVSKQRVSPEDVDKYYGEVINDAKKIGADVIIIAAPSNYRDMFIEKEDEYKKGLGKIAEKHKVMFCDIYSEWNKFDRSYLFYDNVHTSQEGHRKIAEDLIKFINENKVIK